MLKILRYLDTSFLNGQAERLIRGALVDWSFLRIAPRTEHSVTIYQKAGFEDLLASLFEKYGSDKGSRNDYATHTYSRVYSLLLNHSRLEITKVFECGIGTNNVNLVSNMGAEGKPGASLRAWRDYFPNARIFGADIDKDILFTEDRITTAWVDQLSQDSIFAMWLELRESSFDIIIDDGLHTFPAGSTFFENSINHLRRGDLI